MVRILLAVLSCLLAAPAVAVDAERYAAFVADADTGEVLHARRADAYRYPASLTKMMTLYLLFEAIERGELSLDTPLSVSAEAAGRPASRLGLTAGDTIAVEDAIRALIIQSANDVAVVVAEAIGGTEAAFAIRMTARAAALGMTDTHFDNASGLPDPDQRTTARDMARLGYALERDFPQHFHYFAETRFTWDGVVHHTHNGLLGQVEGVTGLKTGYITASGFNIAVTAARGERRLVAVIMGGASAAVRDAHARELIEAAFTSLGARDEARQLAALDMPRLNPVRELQMLTAELAGATMPVAMGSAESTPAATVAFAEEIAPPSTRAGGWSVQVGAFGSEAAAAARLETIMGLGLNDVLASARPIAEPLEAGGRRLWRARYAGLAAEAARLACERLRARGEACFPVPPSGV